MIRFCSIISSVQFLFSLGLSSGLNEQIEARQYFPYDSVNGRNGDWVKSSVTQHNDGATDHEENYIGETAGKKTNLSDFPGNCTVMNLSKNDKSNIDISPSDGISKISEDAIETGKRNNDSISSCTLLKREKLNRYQFHREKSNLKRYQRQKGEEDHGLIFNSPNNEYTRNKSNDRQSFEKSFLNNSNETYTKFSPFQRNRLECLNEVETLENTNKHPKYKVRRDEHNFSPFKGIKSQFITSNTLNENRNRNKRTFTINKDIDESTDLKFDRNMRRVHTFHKSRRYKNRKINVPEKYNIVNKIKNSKLEQNINDEKGMDIDDQNFLKVIQNKSIINSIHRQLIHDYFNDLVRQSKTKKDYIVKNREKIINTYNAIKKKYMSTTMGYQNLEETNYLDADKLFNFIVTTDKDGNAKEKHKLKMDTFDYSDHDVYHCNNYYNKKLSTVGTGTVGDKDEEADYLDDLFNDYDESTDEAKETSTSEHLNDFVEKLKHNELNPKDINKINDFIENIKSHKSKNFRYNDAMLKYFTRGKNIINQSGNNKKYNYKIKDYETQINCIPQIGSMTDVICDKMGMLNTILQNQRNYMLLPNYSNFIATTAQTTQCEVIGTILSPDSSESYITESSPESYNTINIPTEMPSDFVEQNTQLMDQRTEENSNEEISYESEWEETTASDDTELYSDSVGETLANIAKIEATQQRMRNKQINSSLEWNAMRR